MKSSIFSSRGETLAPSSLLACLTSGPAWVAYRALADLYGLPPGDSRLQAARAALLADPHVQASRQATPKVRYTEAAKAGDVAQPILY